MRPASRRASLLLLLTAGALSLLQPTARAAESVPASRGVEIAQGSWGEPGCGPFSLTQTYRNWGPARHYERPVTVVYQAERCSDERGDAVRLTIEGVAAIHRGTSANGILLEERPFHVTGRWEGATNPEGWPPDWWECDVRSAAYSWRIADVYTFEVTVRDGSWSLDVAVGGDSVHWSYDGCAG